MATNQLGLEDVVSRRHQFVRPNSVRGEAEPQVSQTAFPGSRTTLASRRRCVQL